MRENGIQQNAKIKVVNRSQVPQIAEIIAGKKLVGYEDFIKKYASGSYGGFHLYGSDVVIVFRDREIEALHAGVTCTEATIVHELAHAGSHYAMWIYEQNEGANSYTPNYLREGFVTHYPKRHGQLFEEGFAEFLRLKYLREHMTSEERSIIAEKIGADADLPFDTDIYSTTDQGVLCLTPAQVMIKEDGSLTAQNGSYTGRIIEMLVSIDPKIWVAMVTARSDVEGLREVSRRVEKIEKGLYKKLRDHSVDFPQVLEALAHVQKLYEQHKSTRHAAK